MHYQFSKTKLYTHTARIFIIVTMVMVTIKFSIQKSINICRNFIENKYQ